MKTSGIYKIQSLKKPSRCYIGSAVNIGKRWVNHLSDLKNNNHHNRILQNHFNKYGESDLVFIIIEPCFPEFLYELEIAYNLYHFDTELDVIHLINELKDVTKLRLNKMVASEPEMN